MGRQLRPAPTGVRRSRPRARGHRRRARTAPDRGRHRGPRFRDGPLGGSRAVTGDPSPSSRSAPPGHASAHMIFLAVNHVGPNNGGALKRLQVRRAIALAVDRAALVQVRGGPRVTRPCSRRCSAARPVSSRADPSRSHSADQHGDPAAARALLAEAGFPDGLSLRLAFQNSSSYPLMAQVLQSSLERAPARGRAGAAHHQRLLRSTAGRPLQRRAGGVGPLVAVGFPTGTARTVAPSSRRSSTADISSRTRRTTVTTRAPRSMPRSIAPSSRRASELSEQAWRAAARLLVEDAALVPLTEQKLPYAKSRRVRGCDWSVMGLNCDLTSVWLADAAPR